MDVITEAEKMQKAIREIDLLLSSADKSNRSEELVRLRGFFASALSQLLDGCDDPLFLRV